MPHDANWRCGEFQWERRSRNLGTLIRAVFNGQDITDPNIACSYCGSMTPEAMMKRMREGAEIGPTDKPYKIYVGPDHGKFYMNHLTDPALSREFWDAFVSGKMKVGHPGYFYSKMWLPGLREEKAS